MSVTELPGQIGPYRPERRIGAGGMGAVYYAHPEGGEPVAVKVLHPEYAGDPAHRLRFAREVALLTRVAGPYVVGLVGADASAERPWLATPYVPGDTLAQHVQAHGPLTGTNLLTFAAATAHALACIHRAGVAHRDLKPANVILAADGPRVLDFGIAHHLDATAVTATRMVTGTPGWMAPEQLESGATGTASDLFAWGLLTAYAATGRHPFGAPTGIEFRIVTGVPALDGVPAELAGLVREALAKDAAARPTAAALAARTAARHGPTGTAVFPTLADARAAAPPLTSALWAVPTVHARSGAPETGEPGLGHPQDPEAGAPGDPPGADLLPALLAEIETAGRAAHAAASRLADGLIGSPEHVRYTAQATRLTAFSRTQQYQAGRALYHLRRAEHTRVVEALHRMLARDPSRAGEALRHFRSPAGQSVLRQAGYRGGALDLADRLIVVTGAGWQTLAGHIARHDPDFPHLPEATRRAWAAATAATAASAPAAPAESVAGRTAARVARWWRERAR
ncbi:serine/threonine protein kinase [Streptomyces bambusae]|uniref:serine/threonine-protein kinase n=1 Tax=Streptomyces bambusae TaxID=1550616 RepID=UPI001CFE4852|nr:serine/threonine-protein kinase [Streptomyces bambusae]MCB5164107.1 serine/threonine protein kinase [Streptomyces bambusae]